MSRLEPFPRPLAMGPIHHSRWTCYLFDIPRLCGHPYRPKRSKKDYMVPTQTWYIEQVAGPSGMVDGTLQYVLDFGGWAEPSNPHHGASWASRAWISIFFASRTYCKRTDPYRPKRSKKDYMVPTQTWYIEQVAATIPDGPATCSIYHVCVGTI
jgi:hypothetical protein